MTCTHGGSLCECKLQQAIDSISNDCDPFASYQAAREYNQFMACDIGCCIHSIEGNICFRHHQIRKQRRQLIEALTDE